MNTEPLGPGIQYVEPVYVPDHNTVFLGVSAENYAAADRAYWTAKQALGDQPATAGTAALKHLAKRRMAAYMDLVSWAAVTETDRLALEQTQAQQRPGDYL